MGGFSMWENCQPRQKDGSGREYTGGWYPVATKLLRAGDLAHHRWVDAPSHPARATRGVPVLVCNTAINL